MRLQVCLLSTIFFICSAQQNNMMGRIFQNPFMVRVIRRDPQPPPPVSRPSATPSSPCQDGCEPGYVCYGGGCQKMGDSLCSPMCQEHHTCHHGHCHYEPCRPSCGNGKRCINGRCEDIPCRPRCRAGFVCNAGKCERDNGGQCTPACPPGYRCHDGHCDLLNSSPHETCDRPCRPPSRCVNGHCTGEALPVGSVSPTEVRSVSNPTPNIPNLPNIQNLPNLPNLPFSPNGPTSPFVPGSQPGPFSPLNPNEQTNSLPSHDPNSRWLVRDSSGSRVPWPRPPPTIIRPGGATNIPDNTRVPGSSGPIDLNPFPNAADLFPMSENSNSLPPFPRGPSNVGGGSSPLSGVSNSGTGMSLPPLTALGVQNPPAMPPAMPPAQRPAQRPPGNGGELLIPDIAEICQGGNCNGAPFGPGSNVGLNQRPNVPRTQTQTQMVGRGDNCGELTCFENEFCFDPVTSTCIGVNTGDPRAP